MDMFGDFNIEEEAGEYICSIQLDDRDNAFTMRRITSHAETDGYVIVTPDPAGVLPRFTLRASTMAEAIEEATALLANIGLEITYRMFWYYANTPANDAYELSAQVLAEPERQVVLEPHFAGDIGAYAQALTQCGLCEQVTTENTSAWGASVRLTLTPEAATDIVATCLKLANLHPALQ